MQPVPAPPGNEGPQGTPPAHPTPSAPAAAATPPTPPPAGRDPHPRTPRGTRALWAILIVYGLALATIALWPTHVDAPAGGLLRAITRAVPWLTYPRIEFTANILLFVPFGALGMMLLPRARWWYALVAAFAFSTAAELLQLLATDRTSSVQDVVANTLGAALGILAVVFAKPPPRSRPGAQPGADTPQGRPIP